MSKLRVGVIGFAQMHIVSMVDDFLRRAERFEFVGCADVAPEIKPISQQPSGRIFNQATVLKKLGFDKPFESVTALLDEKPDLVLVASENATHAAICCQALSRGIHVILEKPMCMSAAEAKAMYDAAAQGGVKLIVNWPTTWFPGFRTAQKIIADGAVGTPFKFHYRNPESMGPFSYGQNMSTEEIMGEWWYHRKPGGGAMMDYLGYGSTLAAWFLNEDPTEAFAMTMNAVSPFADVEDHAIMNVRFPKAIALLEGTWATRCGGNVDSGPILYGDLGTLVTNYKTQEVAVYTERRQDKPTKLYAPEALPEGRACLADEFLHWLETGDLHPTMDQAVNYRAMLAIDAGFRSLVSGRLEPVTTL